MGRKTGRSKIESVNVQRERCGEITTRLTTECQTSGQIMKGKNEWKMVFRKDDDQGDTVNLMANRLESRRGTLD